MGYAHLLYTPQLQGAQQCHRWVPVMPSCDLLLALPQGRLVKCLFRQYAYCGVLSVGTVRKASAEPVKQQGRRGMCKLAVLCIVMLCNVAATHYHAYAARSE